MSGNDVSDDDNIVISDIGNSSENGLICSSGSRFHLSSYGWYHKITETSDLGDKDLEKKGWSTTETSHSFRTIRSLFRTPGSEAKEGIVTCFTSDGSISVNIYHPSELPTYYVNIYNL